MILSCNWNFRSQPYLQKDNYHQPKKTYAIVSNMLGMSLEGNAFWDGKRNLKPYTLVSLCSLCHIPQNLFWKIFIEIIVAHCLWTTSSSFIATTKSVTKSSLLTFGTQNVLNKHYWDNSKENYKNLASWRITPFCSLYFYLLPFHQMTKRMLDITHQASVLQTNNVSSLWLGF